MLIDPPYPFNRTEAEFGGEVAMFYQIKRFVKWLFWEDEDLKGVYKDTIGVFDVCSTLREELGED